MAGSSGERRAGEADDVADDEADVGADDDAAGCRAVAASLAGGEVAVG